MSEFDFGGTAPAWDLALGGVFAPSGVSIPGGTVLATASRSYYARFVPTKTMAITKIKVFTSVAATNNDECDVGIFSSTGAKLVTAGATAGKMNATAGVQSITVTSTTVQAGTVYYAGFAYGTVGGTAATMITDAMTGFIGQVVSTEVPNVLHGFQAAFPLPTTTIAISATNVANNPIIFLSE